MQTPTIRAIVFACAFCAPHLSPVAAQQRSAPVPPPRAASATANPRAALYSVIGALAGSALATGYYFVSESGNRAGGCRPFTCAMPFLTVSGALSGLFIAKELDAQRRVDTPRAGDRVAFSIVEAGVLAAPTSIDVRDSLIATASDSGAQLLSVWPTPKALRRRATGLTSLRQVVIVPATQSIVLGTSTALWEAPLTTGPATRIGDGPIDALAASEDAVMSAVGKKLRLRRGSGTAMRYDSVQLGSVVSALTYDETARQWWAALDSTIVQIVADSGGLRVGKTLDLPSPARAITTSGPWIAAALGDNGVIAWRRETLSDAITRPVRITQEPRFAYDLALIDDALYVAGGVDGLFRLSLSPVPRVVSSSRQFPFATTVRARGGVVWVGDRTRKTIARVTP